VRTSTHERAGGAAAAGADGDVRHRHALGVQEALEEQVVAQRVDAMRNDLVAALHAGVPPAELARLAAVGRPTLYRLRRSS